MPASHYVLYPNGPHVFYPYDRVRNPDGRSAVVLHATPLRAVVENGQGGPFEIDQGDPEWTVDYSGGWQCSVCQEWLDEENGEIWAGDLCLECAFEVESCNECGEPFDEEWELEQGVCFDCFKALEGFNA